MILGLQYWRTRADAEHVATFMRQHGYMVKVVHVGRYQGHDAYRLRIVKKEPKK